jgi:hypothetical protein
MATTTVTSLLTTTVSGTLTSAAATATSSNRAAPQGGILEGVDPSHYDPSVSETQFSVICMTFPKGAFG